MKMQNITTNINIKKELFFTVPFYAIYTMGIGKIVLNQQTEPKVYIDTP